MGFKPYSKLENFDLAVDQNNIVLEIGSERGEGSSVWLYEWAKQRNIEFIPLMLSTDRENESIQKSTG